MRLVIGSKGTPEVPTVDVDGQTYALPKNRTRSFDVVADRDISDKLIAQWCKSADIHNITRIARKQVQVVIMGNDDSDVNDRVIDKVLQRMQREAI